MYPLVLTERRKKMAAKITELAPEQLRRVCDESTFDFDSTVTLPELAEIIGQDRAVEAIDFGMGVDGDGFNIYALGPVGAGRTSTIQRFVQARAKEKPVPDDWCYVHNFVESNKPKHLRFPPGKGREFRSDMEKLVSELKRDIQQSLEREDYEKERNAIMQQMQKEQSSRFIELEQKAQTRGFTLQRGSTGVYVVPVHQGEPLTGEQFAQLPERQRQHLEEQSQMLQQELHTTTREVRNLEREVQQKLQELRRNTVLFAVEHHIDALKEKYSESSIVVSYLDAVKEDVVSNAQDIIAPEQGSPQQLPFGMMMMPQQTAVLNRYKVNLIVDNSETQGAPVIVESNPTFQNLIGRVERQAQFGMLTTSFNMIKPGALHRANGGYLIVESDHILRNPFAYDALKHAIKDRQIKISDISEMLSLISTAGLEPEPIPLDVKVIIIGHPMIYYMLHNFDEEFPELFKVKADFNLWMDRTDENARMYAQFLATRCKKEGFKHFDKSGIARIVEYGSELVGDQTKLSTRFSGICDIAREANYWAQKNESEFIRRGDVQQAIDARNRRSNRVEERIQEMIEKGDIYIDTEGEVVGQVNGLSVMSLGDYMFGKPSRITARTYVGRGGIVNIEREVRMSGPIHNKGVLILVGYLNGKHGVNKPISLSASLGFEQLYEGVEGDSASSTELYALLSSISGFPIKQGLAVTGSVNQRGEVQPIGGATQKIEGFFDVCKAKGLTGEQGVLIPKPNVKNLMLRDEIVQSVREGNFHIYPVETIDQGIEILTGKEVGELHPDGTYPQGSINHAVDRRLSEFAECWKEFQQRGEEAKKTGEEEEEEPTPTE